MSGVEILQSARQYIAPIVFNAYDEAQANEGLARIATVIDNTVLQEDPVDLEFWGAWFDLRKWVDEKTTQDVFKGDFSIPIDSYEVTAKANRKKLRRANSLAKLDPLAANMGATFERDKVGIVMDVLRDNPTAYDGLSLFNTAHLHPGTGNGTYSNVFDMSSDAAAYSDADNPSVAELKIGLHGAMARLVANRAVKTHLLNSAELMKSLVVIARDAAYWTQLNKIRTMATIDQVSNELMGQFDLYFDPQDSGNNTYDVIYSAPGGPRPVLFVVDEEPSELKFEDRDEFDKGEFRFGLEGYYGAKPGWPQTTVRVQP